MAKTTQRTIRVDDDTWARWQAAVHDADVDVDDVADLIRTAVEAYLAPSAELDRLRTQLEHATKGLHTIAQIVRASTKVSG